jgi:hypothetical protein
MNRDHVLFWLNDHCDSAVHAEVAIGRGDYRYSVLAVVPNTLSPRGGRGRRNGLCAGSFSAPGVGFEPTALRLTAVLD